MTELRRRMKEDLIAPKPVSLRSQVISEPVSR